MNKTVYVALWGSRDICEMPNVAAIEMTPEFLADKQELREQCVALSKKYPGEYHSLQLFRYDPVLYHLDYGVFDELVDEIQDQELFVTGEKFDDDGTPWDERFKQAVGGLDPGRVDYCVMCCDQKGIWYRMCLKHTDIELDSSVIPWDMILEEL